MLKLIHAADFHLDSAFGGLSPQQAAQRRRESRELLVRLANYVNQQGISLVLLAGDLFDSAAAFRDTGEQLAQALGQMQAKVFISPGNHDWYDSGSLWTEVEWPENVHIFRENTLTSVELPEWKLTIHGAAFTDKTQSKSLLFGFQAPEDGYFHIGLLHGDITSLESGYNPLSKEEIFQSGLHYLALGHIHKRTEPFTCGRTLCAWPGCIEGKGFDELGVKGFYEGTLIDGQLSLEFVPFAPRRYEILEVDVSGNDPRTAIESALETDTEAHLYRILLTGETGEGGVDILGLQETLSPRFYTLEIRDNTRMAEDVWQREDENSLRGLFLRELRNKWNRAATEEERARITKAARYGLAALDHRDLG